jgi:hypothetical protein
MRAKIEQKLGSVLCPISLVERLIETLFDSIMSAEDVTRYPEMKLHVQKWGSGSMIPAFINHIFYTKSP